MNGISEVQDRSKWRAVAREMVHWFLFGVIVSLGYLALVLLILWLKGNHVDWIAAVKSGGLLTYASTLAARTAGDYVRKMTRITLFSSFCVVGLLGVIVPAACVYALVLESAIPQVPAVTAAIMPNRVAQASLAIACLALGYGFVFTLVLKLKES
jgi:putative flippase GtrA